MFRRIRLTTALALAAASLSLTACAGVLDWCGKGLNPPAGGWDRHGPG
jgi:hypothetical protein